jgi:hypothetical protein
MEIQPEARHRIRPAVWHGLGLFVYWMPLADAITAGAVLSADLVLCLLATAAAIWSGLRLLPTRSAPVRRGVARQFLRW